MKHLVDEDVMKTMVDKVGDLSDTIRQKFLSTGLSNCLNVCMVILTMMIEF